MNPRNRSTLLDILIGLLVAVISFTLTAFFSFGLSLILTALMVVIAGFIRGKDPNESLIIKATLMNMLFYLLFFAILNGLFHVLLIPATSVVGTGLGIHLRRRFSNSGIRSLVYTGFYFAFVIYMGLLVLPSYLDSYMWREEAEAAPAYKLLTPSKDTIHSSDHAGKVVVLSFWATWCGPCKKQFPSLERTYKNYKDNDQVIFLVINPCGRDKFEKVQEFIRKNPYDLPFVMDLNAAYSKKLNVTSLPIQIIIDRKGVIRSKHFGYRTSENFYEKICSRINALLAEK